MLYKTLKRDPHKATFVFIIMLTSMTGIFVSDIYIPSLQSISREFGININLLSFSVTYYFIIFACAQLFHGPLSERFGRRNIFLVGLIINILGTLIIIFSINFIILNIGRTLQAIGMAAPMSLSRVILREIISDNTKYARFISFLGIGTLMSPVIAPIIGAFLAYFFHWKADFIFILLVSIFCYILAYIYLIETLTNRKKYICISIILKSYVWIFQKNKKFIKHIIISSAIMSAILAYLAISSSLFQQYFGLNEINYSILFGISELFIAIGMFSNGIVIRYISIEKSQTIGIILFLVSGILITIQAVFFSYSLNFIVSSIIIFNFSAGIIFPTSSALAIIPFKKRFGTVGSLYGSISMLAAGVISGFTLSVPFNPNLMIATLILIMSITATIASFKIPDKTI